MESEWWKPYTRLSPMRADAKQRVEAAHRAVLAGTPIIPACKDAGTSLASYRKLYPQTETGSNPSAVVADSTAADEIFAEQNPVNEGEQTLRGKTVVVTGVMDHWYLNRAAAKAAIVTAGGNQAHQFLRAPTH